MKDMSLWLHLSEKRGQNCSGPPRIENGDITTLSKQQYRSGSSVEFRCQKYYAMEGQNRSFCYNGTWTKAELERQKIEVKNGMDASENTFVQHGHSIKLTCKTGCCPSSKCFPISLYNPLAGYSWLLLFFSGQAALLKMKAKYLENDRVQYRCNPGYVLEGSEWIQCKGQKWTPHPPKCLAPCSITRQQLATKNLFVFGSQRKARLIQSNHNVQFQCNEGYVLVAPSVRKCFDGYMDFPLCISERGQNCSGPPRIDNGDIISLSEKWYRSGSSVEFRCQMYYAMEDQNRSFCDNGIWTKVPICLDPCVISRTELESQKIDVKDEIDVPENIFVQRGHSIELTCRTGYVLEAYSSQSTFVIQCDGTPSVIPKCKEITCNSPRISNGSFRPQRTLYHDGDLIRILCDSGLTFEPDNGEKVVECTRNGWSPSPKCVNTNFTEPPTVENAEIVDDTMKKYMNGEKINYQCKDGFEISGSSTIVCTENKCSRFPRCKDVRCSSPPEIQNGQIANVIKEKYLPQEKVYYRCNPGYALLGTPFITCLKKHWTQRPGCR
ncbi:hypothetical protein E2320_010598, partial [Naja naja]